MFIGGWLPPGVSKKRKTADFSGGERVPKTEVFDTRCLYQKRPFVEQLAHLYSDSELPIR